MFPYNHKISTENEMLIKKKYFKAHVVEKSLFILTPSQSCEHLTAFFIHRWFLQADWFDAKVIGILLFNAVMITVWCNNFPPEFSLETLENGETESMGELMEVNHDGRDAKG